MDHTSSKRFIITLSFVCVILSVYLTTTNGFLDKERPDYEFYFTPMWIPLDNPEHSRLFDKTIWVLVGTFTIRMKEPIHLHSLSLKWTGPEPIEIHSASLYRGSKTTLKATDDYLIADGQWLYENEYQKLIFNFPQTEKLYISNTFYLVLTISKDSENILTKGTFEILPDNLPGCLQRSLKHAPVYLTFAPPTDLIRSYVS